MDKAKTRYYTGYSYSFGYYVWQDNQTLTPVAQGYASAADAQVEADRLNVGWADRLKRDEVRIDTFEEEMKK